MNRRRCKQIAIYDFPIGFGGAPIFPENRWVKLAEMISWDLVKECHFLVRNKKQGYRLIRKTLRSQLQYLNRDLGHIRDLVQRKPLNKLKITSKIGGMHP